MSEIRKEQENYMVLGDFNAVSPFDADYYKDKVRMLQTLRASAANNENKGNLFNGELEYGTMSSFLGFPNMDVVQKYTSGYDQRISFPTQVFEEKPGEGRRYNSSRIDYILTSPELAIKCLDARVLNGPETYYLSDHYPVMALFAF
jgi:exodeoxyribonuclease-3